MSRHLLVGCSFTDPAWQTEIPWSVEYSKTHPSYIVAKAGMGIKGICTEALYYLKTLDDVSKVIIVLPTMWRLDLEMDVETYLCNSMVDLLIADSTVRIKEHATRKWIASGGVNYDKTTEQAKIFDVLYKHQGFLVIAKEHFRALRNLILYCKMQGIKYDISAIQDPLNQLAGLEYIEAEFRDLLSEVDYDRWFKFDGKFIDEFLKHRMHPTTDEHKKLSEYILSLEETQC